MEVYIDGLVALFFVLFGGLIALATRIVQALPSPPKEYLTIGIVLVVVTTLVGMATQRPH